MHSFLEPAQRCAPYRSCSSHATMQLYNPVQRCSLTMPVQPSRPQMLSPNLLRSPNDDPLTEAQNTEAASCASAPFVARRVVTASVVLRCMRVCLHCRVHAARPSRTSSSTTARCCLRRHRRRTRPMRPHGRCRRTQSTCAALRLAADPPRNPCSPCPERAALSRAALIALKAFGPSADRPRPGLVGVVCMHVRRCASARETSGNFPKLPGASTIVGKLPQKTSGSSPTLEVS